MTDVVGKVKVVVFEKEEDIDYEALGRYVKDEGPLPPNARLEDYESWSARGRLPDCDCQLIQCVCAQARLHVKGCQYRFGDDLRDPDRVRPRVRRLPRVRPLYLPEGDEK